MKKFIFGITSTALFMSVALAAEFNGYVKKIDGKQITIQKVKKGEKGDDVVLDLSDNVKVVKNKVDPETKKSTSGDAVADGLKNEAFQKPDPFVRVITDDASKVTEIRLIQKKKQ